MTKKYRKKPVVIEAILYDGTLGSANEVFHFMNEDDIVTFSNGQFIIHTLEGDHFASPGDYIIKGVAGEFYPCKPEIFHMTYEEVGDGQT